LLSFIEINPEPIAESKQTKRYINNENESRKLLAIIMLVLCEPEFAAVQLTANFNHRQTVVLKRVY